MPTPTTTTPTLTLTHDLNPTQHLQRWLEASASSRSGVSAWRIGQVVIVQVPAGHEQNVTDSDARTEGQRFVLMHEVDWSPAVSSYPFPHLRRLSGMEEFRELLRWSEDGKFRPLRAAPNLRAGWVLGPLDFAQLIVALRFLYPGAVADWALQCQGSLKVTPYEESAGRQTGRFSVVRKLGSERLAELLQDCCASGCSRTPLWSPFRESGAGTETEAQLSSSGTASDLPRIPLLCAEACNYFISKAREKILGRVD
ncbi:MAG: DR2241 family protein [Candidatus Methylacidiphilales bacterium]